MQNGQNYSTASGQPGVNNRTSGRGGSQNRSANDPPRAGQSANSRNAPMSRRAPEHNAVSSSGRRTTPNRTTGQPQNISASGHRQNQASHVAGGLEPVGNQKKQTRAVGARVETGVATPKAGKLEFFRKVFALTPSEEKHNEVVPRLVEGYDYVFLIIVLVLLAFGSVMVYSASYAYAKTRYGDSYYIITRQAMFMVFGFVGMFVASRVSPDVYKKAAPLIYFVCFFLLCLVPIPGIGVLNKGARRWLKIGIQFQPDRKSVV